MKRWLTILLLVLLVLPMAVAGQSKGFSVSANKQVVFAPGNLQFNAAYGTHLCADGTLQSGTWRFAEHQWDFIGVANHNKSSDYNGWVDLFAWGTSGWYSGANEYQPWAYTGYDSNEDYYISGSPTISMTGDYLYADWAFYNTIGSDAPGTWRTLTSDEWNYLLTQRPNASKLLCKATINADVHGWILFPDGFSSTYTMEDELGYDLNVFTASQWQELETAGAVFFPAAGELQKGNDNLVEQEGYNKIATYWTASPSSNDSQYAAVVDCTNGRFAMDFSQRWIGLAVRPVKEYVKEADDLCTDGTLLFREDFGGNDPNDPRISLDPVPSMSYKQLTDDYFGVMSSGSYLRTKQGYCNGDTTAANKPENRGSQWHLQDDHTYPDDITRGYFLEIDARGDNAKFYQTTITDLCPDLRLTFSAYVANVMTWGQYVGSPGKFAYPRLLFTLTDPTTGDELVPAYDTGDIPYDDSFEGDYKCWQYSAKWNYVGMNFTVPDGVEEVTLTIYNNVTSHIGNDFALDDIEIRLCLPVSVKSASPVCRKESHTMTAVLEDASALTSPEYRWEYSADGSSWTILPGESAQTLTIDEVAETDEGWYRVTVANAGNLDHPNCRAVSEPVQLVTKECEVPPVEPPVDPPVEPTCPTILVNKYDWVLLVDNVTVRELYPDRQVVAYKWFKDDELIEGATEDDYSEESILHGVYQVFLTLDDSTEVCSNIIDLRSTVVPTVTTIRAYNSSGVLLGTWETSEPDERPQLPSGIYLLLIEQGDNVYSEKVFVP